MKKLLLNTLKSYPNEFVTKDGKRSYIRLSINAQTIDGDTVKDINIRQNCSITDGYDEEKLGKLLDVLQTDGKSMEFSMDGEDNKDIVIETVKGKYEGKEFEYQTIKPSIFGLMVRNGLADKRPIKIYTVEDFKKN